MAHEGMAQAAASTLGVAFLIDNEGNSCYRAGRSQAEWTRFCDIGQGSSVGVRHYPWEGNPSFYGGVAFLYVGGGKNHYSTSWFGQGSAYFLGAGILVDEGEEGAFCAEVDSQGQGLHLAAGILIKEGGHSQFQSDWGSLGSAGDRAVGMLINKGDSSDY